METSSRVQHLHAATQVSGRGRARDSDAGSVPQRKGAGSPRRDPGGCTAHGGEPRSSGIRLSRRTVSGSPRSVSKKGSSDRNFPSNRPNFPTAT